MFAAPILNDYTAPIKESYSVENKNVWASRSTLFQVEKVFKSFAIDYCDSYQNSFAIKYKGTILFNLPNELSFLKTAIERAQSILALEDDWDDEGGTKYDEKTWISAMIFLANYAVTLFQDFNIKIAAPKIFPGPKGSIEILWEEPSYRLLINIAENGEDALFYADTNHSQVSEGHFKVKDFSKFLLPIAIHH